MKQIMKRAMCIMAVVSAVLLFVTAAQAQEPLNQVTFNGFSLRYPLALANGVTVRQYAGDSSDLPVPEGPQPARTEVVLTHGDTPQVTIRLYNTADFAEYPFVDEQFADLRDLLTRRSDLTPLMIINTPADVGGKYLPFLPIQPATQAIRARAAYVDVGEFSGIGYITSYGQDASPILAEALRYTFQGLNADGTVYVSLIAPLATGVIANELPADFNPDVFGELLVGAFNATIADLNAATAADFSPSLDSLTALIGSFTLTDAASVVADSDMLPTAVGVEPVMSATPTTAAAELSTEPPTQGGIATEVLPPTMIIVMTETSVPVVATETPIAPTVVPTIVATTGAPINIEGAWRLVSSGAANGQIPIIPDSVVTIEFSGSQVSGNGGCNTFRGAFAIDNGALTISGLLQSLRACADSAILAQETTFLVALTRAQSVALTSEGMTITTETTVLTFSR